jgi:uncharacterized protein
MEQHILIAGGSGFIGKFLAEHLSKRYRVSILSRSSASRIHGCKSYYWNPAHAEYDAEAFIGVTCIINLSGVNVSEKRWTQAQKKRILESRTQALKTLHKAVSKEKPPISQFISTSAVGYYGSAPSTEYFTEEQPAGSDFLAEVCCAWETAAQEFEQLHIPVTIIRLGVVMHANEGAFKKMAASLPFKLFGIPGTGSQFLPWVHINDVVAFYSFCIEHTLPGIWNLCAPEHTRFVEFAQAIAQKKSSFTFRIPQFILQIILGNMSVLLTHGNAISSKKSVNAGFTYECETRNKLVEKLFS